MERLSCLFHSLAREFFKSSAAWNYPSRSPEITLLKSSPKIALKWRFHSNNPLEERQEFNKRIWEANNELTASHTIRIMTVNWLCEHKFSRDGVAKSKLDICYGNLYYDFISDHLRFFFIQMLSVIMIISNLFFKFLLSYLSNIHLWPFLSNIFEYNLHHICCAFLYTSLGGTF